MKFDLLLEIISLVLLIAAIIALIAIFVTPSAQQGGNIVSDLISGIFGIFGG